MAKELYFFKFEPNQWENGNIQTLSREDKGLFMDLCSMYWSRLGDVSLKFAIQKLCAGNALALNSLCDEKIIEVLDDKIVIKFLDRQLNGVKETSKANSKSANSRWDKVRKQRAECDRNATAMRPHTFRNATASIAQCESDAEDSINNNINNNINSTVTAVVYSIAKATEIVLRDLEWIATVETSYSLNAEHFEIALEDFKKHCISIGRNEDRTIYEFKNHFVNWVRIKKQKKQKTVTDKL